jgi:TPR repeat protein
VLCRYDSDQAKEHEKAVAWFRKGAEAGLPRAMFNLGCSLDMGEGVEADYTAAASWFQRAMVG